MKNITTTYRTDAKPAIHAIKGSVKELGFGGRQYQIDAYNQFIDERNTLFISPTASGKSLVQVVCAAKQILDTNYTQKQLFIAPQLDIGNNFSEYKIKHIKVDGKNYEWEVTVNCCKNNKQSVKRLKKFLLSSHDYSSLKNKNKIGGCTAVATSAAFSAVWNDLTKKQKLFAIKNLSARIDESHHVMGVSNETDQNRLGDFVKFSLENNGHIHLTTATFFRGDNQPIIDLEYLPMFSKFAVPFMQHWQCLGLSSLTQEYHTYTDEEDLRQQVLAHIKSNPNQKPMIIVPSAGRGYFEDHEVKKTFIKSFVSDLKKVFGENKVLDLVSKDTQKAHKKRLTQDIRDFSCVVTCCIGREGTDWEECNTVHNTTVDGNVGLAIQKLGRPMRSHKDKTDIVMLNYFPSMPSFDDDREKVRSALSDRYNAVMVGSMLNDAFHPIVMPAKIKKKYKSKNNNDKDVATLEEVYGPASNNLLEDFYKSVDALPDDQLNNDTIDAIANKLIEEYKDAASFDVNAEDVRECLKKQLVRSKNPAHPKLKLEPIDVEYVREHGWDKVIEENVKGKTYFTGFSDTNALAELQKFLKGTDKASYEEHVNEAKKYKHQEEYDLISKDNKFYAVVGSIHQVWPDKNFYADVGWKYIYAKVSYEEHLNEMRKYKNASEYNQTEKDTKVYANVDRINDKWPNKDIYKDAGWTNRLDDKASYEEHVIEAKKYNSKKEYEKTKKDIQFYATVGSIQNVWPNKNIFKDVGWENKNASKASYEEHVKEMRKYKDADEYNRTNKNGKFYTTVGAMKKYWQTEKIYNDAGWRNKKATKASYERHVEEMKKYKNKNAYDGAKKLDMFYTTIKAIKKHWPDKNFYSDCGWRQINIK